MDASASGIILTRLEPSCASLSAPYMERPTIGIGTCEVEVGWPVEQNPLPKRHTEPGIWPWRRLGFSFVMAIIVICDGAHSLVAA